jgi:hypothetical protein
VVRVESLAVGQETLQPTDVNFLSNADPATASEAFELDAHGLESRVQFAGFLEIAFGYAEPPRQFLSLRNRMAKLGKPTYALDSSGGIRGTVQDSHSSGVASMHLAVTAVLSFPPFWSRNRLTFLHNERYQGGARYRFSP